MTNPPSGGDQPARKTKAGILQEAAREEIKRRVLSGEMGSGTLLSEEALAAELKMSRTPVRQALQQLVSLGLLERFPGRGVMVSMVDVTRMRNIIEVQECLLAWCLPRLCTQRDVDLADAMAAYEDQRRALTDGDTPSILEAARRMDVALVAASGNAEMARIMREISDLLLHAAAHTLKRTHDFADAIAEHGTILEAIQRRDLTGLNAALARHGAGIRERLASGGAAHPT